VTAIRRTDRTGAPVEKTTIDAAIPTIHIIDFDFLILLNSLIGGSSIAIFRREYTGDRESLSKNSSLIKLWRIFPCRRRIDIARHQSHGRGRDGFGPDLARIRDPSSAVVFG
jgi:hypothetical protein